MVMRLNNDNDALNVKYTEARQKIDQYCKRVKANLDKCSLQGKKQALNTLDVQVVAVPEKIKIRVAVPLEFITIERTSGCPSCTNVASVPFQACLQQ